MSATNEKEGPPQPTELGLLWLPDRADLPELRKLLNSDTLKFTEKNFLRSKKVNLLKKFISNACNLLIDFKDVKPKTDVDFEYSKAKDAPKDPHATKNITSPVNYSASLYNIICEFHVERKFTDCYKNLVKLFCKARNGETATPEVWLNFDTKLVDAEELRSIDKDVNFRSFSLGNIVGLNTFVQHFHSSSILDTKLKYKVTQVTGEFQHDFQKLELFFVVGRSEIPVSKRSSHTHRMFKMKIKYASIHRLVICSTDSLSVYFHLLNAPLLYAVSKTDEPQQYTNLLQATPDTEWLRVLDLYEGCPSELQREFCMNTVLKLEFAKQDYHILLQLVDHRKLEVYFSPMKVITATTNIQINGITTKEFDCFYALKCILSRSYDLQDQLSAREELKEINKYLAEKCEENPTAIANALFNIYNALDQGSIVIFSSAIKDLYEKLSNDVVSAKTKTVNNLNTDEDADSEETNSILYVKRAILMPTHVRFLPLQPTLTNRMLKAGELEFFVRVTTRDTDLDKLNFSTKSGNNKLQRAEQNKFFNRYIKPQLLNGFKIGKRLHLYLGGSTSQLKSHGLWFYAKDSKGRTRDTIRKATGQLDAIRHAPKYMARMGQSFSQAMGRIKVPQAYTNVTNPDPDVLGCQKIYMSDDDSDDEKGKKKFLCGKYSDSGSENEDIVEKSKIHEKDPYNFSDGIGRLSQDIADEIYKELELEEERPSAFQIRYAGCKGMLVVDPRLKGKRICFRSSMKKYESTDDSLEILKTSKQRNMFLNRPFITILEQKGIPIETFVHLQKQMIQSIIKSLFYEKNAHALLKSHCTLRLNFDGLLESGISFTEDPLFRSMIFAIFKTQMNLLKTKARIAVPEDSGRTMFGVLDETNTLEYGEVFIQYTKWGDDPTNTVIIEGIVLVTKMPCMHAGDVRKFVAVDVEELRHIKDCIVFPARGPRPHPDEMAGSDLDGDEYTILWFEDLIFEDHHNSPAMHFAMPKDDSMKLDREVDFTDEVNHFCHYLLNDTVGLLASAHLARADYEPGGIKSKVCLSLAKKYSKALDFAKTGKTAVLSKAESLVKYPDFMEKLNEKKTYMSTKALGHLYRNCKHLQHGLEATSDKMEFRMDPDLIFEDWKKYERSALRTYRWYSKKVTSSLKAYGLNNEGEFLSVNLIKNPKNLADDVRDLMNILEREVLSLFRQLEKFFFAEFGGKKDDQCITPEEKIGMCQKASAWYAVTYIENTASESRYFGLPWAVTDLLIDIKMMMRSSEPSSDSILNKKSSFVEMAIDTCLKKHFPQIDDSLASHDVSEYKMAVLDTAHNVLFKWVHAQKDNLIHDISELEKCASDIFERSSCLLMSCDAKCIELLLKNNERKKVTSPGYYILDCLMQIAAMGTGQDPNVSYCDAYQEFGLFAWITLVKLAISCNVQYLGIRNESGEYATASFHVTEEDLVDTIQLPLSDERYIPIIKFKEKFIHNEKSVIEYLKDHSGLKEIHMRPLEIKGKRYFLRITVKGSQFEIARLKNLVVMEQFYNCVVNGKPINFVNKQNSDKKRKYERQ